MYPVYKHDVKAGGFSSYAKSFLTQSCFWLVRSQWVNETQRLLNQLFQLTFEIKYNVWNATFQSLLSRVQKTVLCFRSLRVFSNTKE